MNQKPLFLAVILTALLVIGGAFWVMQKRQIAERSVVETQAKPDQQSVEMMKTPPTFEEAIAPNIKSQTGLPKGRLYTSEKNKFSVMLPPDTKVSESDEVGYTLTFFALKESPHEIIVTSYDGDINANNLQVMIASGKIRNLSGGSFASENQVQCGDSSSVCFLAQLYAENGFPLVGLIENIVSKTEFQKVYSITMGTTNAEVTDKDIALFGMIRDSFRLVR